MYFPRSPFFSSVPTLSSVQPELLNGINPDIRRLLMLPTYSGKKSEEEESQEEGTIQGQ
jgi:hypothetical protein